MTPEGLVTDDSSTSTAPVAAGGAGMTTVAYCAVSPEGRTDRHQIHWRPEALPGLRRLTDAVHAEGAAASAQIGHAGPVADGRSNRCPRCRRAGCSSRWRCTSPAARRRRHRADRRAHADAARMAVEAGFDAVEIHLGHNYLASAFLSPRLNRRSDDYGGSLENRARFAREIARAVRDAVGDRIAVMAKLNLDDGVRRGLHARRVGPGRAVARGGRHARRARDDRRSSLLNPMYLFKGPAPLREFAAAMREPVRTGVRLFGRTRLHGYPYQDAYLLARRHAGARRGRLPMILLGGVTSRRGDGRGAARPDSSSWRWRGRCCASRIWSTACRPIRHAVGCIHCNRCMPTIYTGTRCVEV